MRWSIHICYVFHFAAATVLLCERHRLTTSSCRVVTRERFAFKQTGTKASTKNAELGLAQRIDSRNNCLRRTNEAFSSAAATRSLSLSCLLTWCSEA